MRPRVALTAGTLLLAALLAAAALSPRTRSTLRRALWFARIALEVNVDEDDVPDYVLPDPLLHADGAPVADAEAWWARRRPEILALFEREVYGRSPQPAGPVAFQVSAERGDALGGTALRRQVRVQLLGLDRSSGARRSPVHELHGPSLDLLLYAPRGAAGPVPLFLGLNFRGNHAVHPDPEIALSRRWMPEDPAGGVEAHRATERSRGATRSRWPVEAIVARGYALATAYYGDLDPDFPDGFQNGVHGLFRDAGRERPAPDEWGAIAAWAFGLRRALDYLERDPAVDASRVALVGHSRLGKAALWAGALDPRFALVISNQSGCGGAALFRRRYGETVALVNRGYPEWFCANFHRYADREDALPVDQHMLLALIAPRPLYVASAAGDRWSDPRGEFLAARAASPVYRLLGSEGLAADVMPPVGEPVHSRLGYHVRPGGHELTAWDWERFLDFADRHLGGPQAAAGRAQRGAAERRSHEQAAAGRAQRGAAERSSR